MIDQSSHLISKYYIDQVYFYLYFITIINPIDNMLLLCSIETCVLKYVFIYFKSYISRTRSKLPYNHFNPIYVQKSALNCTNLSIHYLLINISRFLLKYSGQCYLQNGFKPSFIRKLIVKIILYLNRNQCKAKLFLNYVLKCSVRYSELFVRCLIV